MAANVQVLLKNSGVKGKLPDAGSAAYGELFINYHSSDPMLCFKDNAGEIVEIKPPRTIDGGGGETPPDTGNVNGDTLWDGTHLLVWDADKWIKVGPSDLAYVQKADKGEVTNTVGDGFEIPAVNNAKAGLMLPADKTNLDNLVAGGASLWKLTGSDLAPKDSSNDVVIGDDNIKLNSAGYLQLAGANLDGEPGTRIGVNSDGTTVMPGLISTYRASQSAVISATGSTGKVQLMGTGGINAEGTFSTEGDTSYVSVNRTGTLSDSAALYLGFNNGVEKFKVQQDGNVITKGDVRVGGTYAAPNIDLKPNGNIFAEGKIQSAGNPLGGGEVGVLLDGASGAVVATAASAGNVILKGFIKDDSDPYAQITAGGSATFGTFVKAYNPTGSTGQAFSALFPSGRAVAEDDLGNIKWELKADGKATFTGDVTAPNITASGNITAAGEGKFNNITCAYNATGSASVDGDGIYVVDNSGVLSANLSVNGLDLGGTIPSDPNINLKSSDGSITAKGSITPNTVIFNLNTDDPSSWHVTQETYTDEHEVEKTREVRQYVGETMDVKQTLLAITGALESLKTAAASATTCEELRGAIETALADV